MPARRKTTGPQKSPGYKKPTKISPCPLTPCGRCGHPRNAHEGQFGCFAAGEGAGCSCNRFIPAKPKKPAAKKRKKVSSLLPYVMRSTQIARVVSAPSVQQIPKLPTKADWSLEGPSPAQVQAIREHDGSRDSGLLRDSYWEEQPCRFSGNGHEGCFVSPVNRHGGPCVPCWARARQRMQEQKAEIAKLGGKP